MKSRDTVHLYRGPSSWSFWPTMDNSCSVTREVIYGQETLAMLVIFVNMNRSGQFIAFFFYIWHNSRFSLESHSYLLIVHFHIVLQLENPGTYIHLAITFSALAVRDTGSSSFLSKVSLEFLSEEQE